MVHVHHRGKVAVPVDFAFEYVSDFTRIGDWMFGVQSARRVGDIARGHGAVYEGSIKLGATLKSTIVVTDFDEGTRIVTESQAGFVNTSTWTFAALGDGLTQLSVAIDYELPGGLAGRALGKAIEPFIAIAIRHSDEKLRSVLERRYQGTDATL